MKKLTKAMVEQMKAGNVVFEKDGFIKIVSKTGAIVLDWVNADTLRFASANYEELDKECDQFYADIVEKKYTGTNLEKIEKVEEEYSDHDKAMIAQSKGCLNFRAKEE